MNLCEQVVIGLTKLQTTWHYYVCNGGGAGGCFYEYLALLC